jgi:hypothetical protein
MDYDFDSVLDDLYETIFDFDLDNFINFREHIIECFHSSIIDTSLFGMFILIF